MALARLFARWDASSIVLRRLQWTGRRASIPRLHVLRPRRGIARLATLRCCWQQHLLRRRSPARPRTVITRWPRGGDLPTVAHTSQCHGATALPNPAVDDEGWAIGRRDPLAHHHGGAATVFRKRFRRACDRHDRAVGEPPDTAGLVAGN